jgi:hypothetical protein
VNDPIERWLPVPGWESLYEVSDLGRIRSLHRFGRGKRGGLLKPFPGHLGRYLSVRLSRSGKHKNRLVHQLVLEAFTGPRPPGMESLHGPGGSQDNRLANLSYGTRRQNSGPDRARDGTTNRGERCGSAKLTAAIVIECRRRYAAGEETLTAMAREHGVSIGHMSQIVSGKKWAHLPVTSSASS